MKIEEKMEQRIVAKTKSRSKDQEALTTGG